MIADIDQKLTKIRSLQEFEKLNPTLLQYLDSKFIKLSKSVVRGELKSITLVYTLEYASEKDGSDLGLAKMALAIYGDKYIIPSIYLHIMIAIDLMNLLRIEEAMEHMEIAWQLAKEDHIIAPFAQHYSLLQGLVDRFFKKNHPELFEMTVKAAMRFGAGWIKIHNEDGKKTVTKELNALEFTIAMLYNRNWRVKEIAFHLEMSERTVKNYLSTIYEKLDISSRKELRQYMLQ